MRGINPYYLYLIGNGFVFTLIVISMQLLGMLRVIYVIGIVFGIAIIYLAIIFYSYSKVRKINTGKLIYRGTIKIGNWHHILFGLVFVLLGIFIIYYFVKGMMAIILSSFILFLGFLISNLKQTHYLSIYENGVVVDGIAFYNYGEIEKKETNNKLILKIKGIPKEIVLEKTSNKWKYENWNYKNV
ncbi:hypothetical protein ACO3VM_05975 [Methanocaldococcus sp. 10A]